MNYAPKDPKLPLVVHANAFDRNVYEPISSLANYVRSLFDHGFTPETLRDDFSDLYHLDFYHAQIDNGGHSQFVGNSRSNLDVNIARARQAADLLGLDETVAQLDACAAWCRTNPEEAANQDGFDNRATALEALDRTHDPIFGEEALANYLNTLPTNLRDTLCLKLYLPNDTDAMIDSYLDKVMDLSKTLIPSVATQQASHLLDPLIEWRATCDYGATPSERRSDYIQSLRTWLGQYLDDRVDTLTTDALREAYQERIQSRLTNHGRMVRSKYHISTFVWISQHPDLKVLDDAQLAETIKDICAQSPFTAIEWRRRDLNALRNSLPERDSLHLSILLGQVLSPLQPDEFNRDFTRSEYEDKSGTTFRGLSTGQKRFYLGLKSKHASLHLQRPSRRQKLLATGLEQAQQLGLIKPQDVQRRLMGHPVFKAGTKLAETQITQERRVLFDDLYVPEAFALWWPRPQGETEDPRFLSTRAAALMRGIPSLFSRTEERIIWQMLRDDKIVTMDATREGVRIMSGPLKATFTAHELAAYRQAHDA